MHDYTTGLGKQLPLMGIISPVIESLQFSAKPGKLILKLMTVIGVSRYAVCILCKDYIDDSGLHQIEKVIEGGTNKALTREALLKLSNYLKIVLLAVSP